MIEEKRVLRHESTVRAALAPPLIAMAALALLLLGLVFYLISATRWVTHSSEVNYASNRVMRLAVDMQAGKRGYLLNRDAAYLAPYTKAEEQIDTAFKDLLELVEDNPAQTKRAEQMRSGMNVWRKNTEAELERFRDTPANEIGSNLNSSLGRAQMDTVRDAFDALSTQEIRLRTERAAAAETAFRVAVWGGGIATLGIGIFLAAATRRHLGELGAQYEIALEGEALIRERLSTTLTSIGDGVIVADTAGRITLLNPVAETLTGWTNGEARNVAHKTVFNIWSEETGEPIASPIEEVLRSGETVLLANHALLKRRDGSQIAIEDSASPVRGKDGKVSGVVLVFRDVTTRKAQEAELAAALAKNTQIAETLQRSMLISPGATQFPGLRFATVYEPAWDEAMVGGDFFDLFSYQEGSVAMVVGDATGKGLEAAATTSEVKYALRAYLHDDPDPGIALTRLNRFLADAHKDDNSTDYLSPSFVSLTVAVLNTKTGALMTASAGAEVPLLLRADGEAIEAGETGTMLGASADSLFYAARFVMEAGDTLAMVTDGVTEARRGRREFFGVEGFAEAVKRASEAEATTLETVAASVVAAAKEYAGGRLHDDVCLLVARRD